MSLPVHIGTSGWSYAYWQVVLYPSGTPAQRWLVYYSQRYDSVELNSSYYHWPREVTFTRWRQRLPDQFRFSVKAPRRLTHGLRLYNPEYWIGRIICGLAQLEDRLGVLLVQLSPQFAYGHARLAYFLTHIPTDLKIAFEFWRPNWHQEGVFELLERHGAAYCVMSGAQLPCGLLPRSSMCVCMVQIITISMWVRIARRICAGGRNVFGNG